jgi:hypothetical protein
MPYHTMDMVHAPSTLTLAIVQHRSTPITYSQSFTTISVHQRPRPTRPRARRRQRARLYSLPVLVPALHHAWGLGLGWLTATATGCCPGNANGGRDEFMRICNSELSPGRPFEHSKPPWP